MKKSNFRIITETTVNAPKSMLTITPGETISIPCVDFISISTVRSAATRLNKRLNRIEFIVTSPDKGATIVIHRKAANS